MSKRNRKHISLTEKLAATLACLLPEDQRNDLRERKLPAKQVISLFQFHHIIFHSFDGDDLWHNLHPMQTEAHRERSKGDTSTVAKVKKINETWNKFTASMAQGQKPPKKVSRWPKQKIPTRRKGR